MNADRPDADDVTDRNENNLQYFELPASERAEDRNTQQSPGKWSFIYLDYYDTSVAQTG